MNSSEDGKRVRLSLRDLEAYRGQGPGKKYGNKLRFYCPIHGSDHQRSLKVDPKTGHFKCYACGAWGYLEEYQGAPYKPLREAHEAVQEPRPKTDLLPVIKELQRALPGSLGEEYLKRRGIPLEVALAYGTGYAAYGKWPHLANGKPVRQWKWGRVTFPHTNPKGEVINLYGRAVGADNKVPKEQRHDHLPGPKGVFNGPALNAETVYICEGVFDALSLITAGYPNAVAIFGVNGLRWDWVKAKRLVFCLDQDQAGQQWKDLAWYASVVLGKEAYFLPKEAYGGCKDLNEAWAKYGHLDIGTPEDPTGTPSEESAPPKPGRCPYCGGSDFWLAPWGSWVCRKCHPPVHESEIRG